MPVSKLVLFILLTLSKSSDITCQTKNFLALGDSYTIGEGVAEKDQWPNQLAVSLSIQDGSKKFAATIIATTGWRTDNLLNAITIANLKNDYDLVSLLIGVNNQYQNLPIDQYAIEFEELLITSIRLAKGKSENVFVVSIPDYGYTPYGLKNKEKVSKEIDLFNEVNKRIADQYKVKYVNITAISRRGITEPNLIAPDGLHPSGEMYQLWVKEIAKSITLK